MPDVDTEHGTIRCLTLNGDTLDLHPQLGSRVEDLIGIVSSKFQASLLKHKIALIYNGRVLENCELVDDLFGAAVNVALSKVTTVEMLGTAIAGRGDANYLAGCVLAPNNCIYLAPHMSGQVLCINTDAGILEMIGPELTGLGVKYSAGGVLAPNNCIYFAPRDAGQVLCINTDAGTVEMIGPELAADGYREYVAGGVLAPNNCIYFAPGYAGQVLCINTDAGTVEMIGPELDGGVSDLKYLKYCASGVLAPNKCIYFAPGSAGQVLCINTDAGTVEMIGPELDGRVGALK